MRMFNKLILLSIFLLLVPLVNAVCTDSDNGKNYLVKGTCNNGTVSYTDYCTGGGYNNLIEYYCSGSFCLSETKSCTDLSSSYACVDGKCVLWDTTSTTTTSTSTIPTTIPCNTTDPPYCSSGSSAGYPCGNDSTVAGKTTYPVNAYGKAEDFDTCLSNTILNESYCEKPWLVSYHILIDCKQKFGSNYICSGGRCILYDTTSTTTKTTTTIPTTGRCMRGSGGCINYCKRMGLNGYCEIGDPRCRTGDCYCDCQGIVSYRKLMNLDVTTVIPIAVVLAIVVLAVIFVSIKLMAKR